jgi:hypothetical protein
LSITIIEFVGEDKISNEAISLMTPNEIIKIINAKTSNEFVVNEICAALFST